jgi:hypothetical protein
MIQNFDLHAKWLRKLGNTRMPYMILAEANCDLTQACCNIRAIAIVHMYTANDPDDIEQQIDSIVNTTKAPVVLVVVTSIEQVPDAIRLAFSEIHTALPAPANKIGKNFKEVYRYNNGHDNFVYVRKYIDSPDIIALVPKQIQDVLPTEGFQEWQPWHTLIINKSNGEACQVIWDTREIVGYAKLTSEVIEHVLTANNANDNCFLLFDRVGLPQMSTFNNFIIEQIQEQ